MSSIVTAEDAGQTFEGWCLDADFADIEARPSYGKFGRSYYPAVCGEAAYDQSFAVMQGERPVLLVLCAVRGDALDYFGLPVGMFRRRGLEDDAEHAAVASAFQHLDILAGRGHGYQVTVDDAESRGTLSAVGIQCVNRRAQASLRTTGICDLTGGEAAMRRSLRKSFRSLINWGRTNLKIEVVCSNDPNRNLFDSYQKFHREVAGRITRPQLSWDIMFEFIANGRGELVLGSLDSELVAGTLVVDGSNTSLYASGVYDRNRFDKPMAHWPLWSAIIRSAGRGMASFELGDLPLSGSASEKEFAIGYFKRGFASSIATSIVWTWKPSN